MFERITTTRSELLALLCAALGVCFLTPADAPAQTVNMEQLTRIISGETILERDDDEDEHDESEEFTDEFPFGDCRFVPRGANAYFSLEPGYQLHLYGEDDGEQVELFITVLRQTYDVLIEIDGEVQRVRTRVIQEREFIDCELYEISHNYYALCRETNDIYYFGEAVCFFEDDVCIGDDGSWLAGQNGAMPGIIMPGTFLLGSRYYQEVAPGVALDLAEHIDMGLTMTVPAGILEDCVLIAEGSGLEDPGAEGEKYYAKDIGLIKDGELELIGYGFISGRELRELERDPMNPSSD